MTPETQRHQQFAANFVSVATAVDDWDPRTPVGEWCARDVVAHLIDWLPPSSKTRPM